MLIKQASSQSILPFLSGHKGSKAPRRPVARKPLPRVRKSQCDRLRQMVIKILGTTQLPQYTLTWTDLPHRNMCPRQRIRFHPSAET
jgi:hypothetical protein